MATRDKQNEKTCQDMSSMNQVHPPLETTSAKKLPDNIRQSIQLDQLRAGTPSECRPLSMSKIGITQMFSWNVSIGLTLLAT